MYRYSCQHSSKHVFRTPWSRCRTTGKSSPSTNLKNTSHNRAHPSLSPIGHHAPDPSSNPQQQQNATEGPAVCLTTLTKSSSHRDKAPLQIFLGISVLLRLVCHHMYEASLALLTFIAAWWRLGVNPTMNATKNLISVTGSNQGPMLGPAPEIGSRRKRRSSASFHPPPLLGSNQRKHYSDLGAASRTPATPRAGILRMPSQQAEKDAVDTLLFMSSPNNSSRLAHTSADARAQRHDFAPPQRRVMFEDRPPGEGISGAVPASRSAAYYRAEPSR